MTRPTLRGAARATGRFFVRLLLSLLFVCLIPAGMQVFRLITDQATTPSAAAAVPVDPLISECIMYDAFRTYIAQLSEPDITGQPDGDIDNDYLADLPPKCRPIARGIGKALVDSWMLEPPSP